MTITLKLLDAISPLEYAKKFLTPLQNTCEKYNINTTSRVLCFLSQVGHESGGLFYTEELSSGREYDGRSDLGNIKPGDGIKYKGRGLIQITGRANYTELSKDLGIDFINNPSLLGAKTVKLCYEDQLINASMSAGWFWNKNNLNRFADKINVSKKIDAEPNLQIYKNLTKAINGGYNGLSDRIDKYNLLFGAI